MSDQPSGAPTPWTAGEGLTAKKLNESVTAINRMIGGVGVPQQTPNTPVNIRGELVQMQIVTVGDDYLTCYPYNGTAAITTQIAYVAKSYLLRRTPFDGQTRNGISYVYSSSSERTASKVGESDITEKITPSYQVNDIIYVAKNTMYGTSLITPDGIDIVFADANLDGRCWAQVNDMPATVAHASTHQNGGADEVGTATPAAAAIPKADASGKLDTWVTDASTSAKGKVQLAAVGGTTSGTAVQASDTRLSDARTPTAHATSHKSGGTDAVKLDELAAPTDVTTLNASTTAHGLLPKLSGSPQQYLSGDGIFRDLPEAANWFLADTASDISGYKTLSTSVPSGAKTTVAVSCASADTEIEQWSATAAETPRFLGEQIMHLHVHAAKTAGTKGATLYAKFFKRDSGATETLLGTTESVVLGASEADCDLSIPIDSTAFASTDRGVLKLYGSPSGAGTDPTVTVYYLGTTYSRVEASAATVATADVVLRHTNDFRLTLESGVAVSTTDQINKTEVFLCPKSGGAATNGQIALLGTDNTTWAIHDTTQLSLGLTATRNGTTTNGNKVISGLATTVDLVVGQLITGTGVGAGSVIASIDSATQITGTVNSSASGTVAVTFKCPAPAAGTSGNYDLFIVNIAGTPTLVFGPVWTSDTARATAITQKDGIPCLSGAFSVGSVSYAEGRLRHVGSVGIMLANDGQTAVIMTAQSCMLLLCNVDNTVPIRAFSQDPTTSWSYTAAAARVLRADTNNKIEFILCDSRSIFSQLSIQVTKAGFQWVSLDTVAYPAADPTYNNGAYLATNDAGDTLTNVASLAKTVAYGRHSVIPSEYGVANNTTYGESNMGFTLEVEL